MGFWATLGTGILAVLLATAIQLFVSHRYHKWRKGNGLRVEVLDGSGQVWELRGSGSHTVLAWPYRPIQTDLVELEFFERQTPEQMVPAPDNVIRITTGGAITTSDLIYDSIAERSKTNPGAIVVAFHGDPQTFSPDNPIRLSVTVEVLGRFVGYLEIRVIDRGATLRGRKNVVTFGIPTLDNQAGGNDGR